MKTAWGSYFRTLTPWARKKALGRWGYDTPHEAIERCDMEALRFLLKHEASVTQKIGGESAFAVAIRKRNFEAIRLTAGCGAYIDFRDAQKNTPLSLAVKDDDLELAEVLLEVGARVNLRNGEGYTPLMLAALNGNVEMARLLLDHGAHVNRGRCYGGPSRIPICEAIRGGNFEVVKLFVERGANLYERDPSGFRVLELAQAQAEACASPLSREAGPFPRKSLRSLQGTDPNPEGSGPDASGDATGASLVAIVKYLRERVSVVGEADENGNTELMVAARHGDLDKAERLIFGGAGGDSADVRFARISAKNKYDRTALHYAAMYSQLSVARLLVGVAGGIVGVGNFIDVFDNHGRTALMYSARNGDVSMVDLLLSGGAHLEAENPPVRTPSAVVLARREKSRATLHRVSVGVSTSSEVGYTPLMYAARRGRAEVVNFLVGQVSDINARDCFGRTALIHSTWSVFCKLSVVKALVEGGADVNARDMEGSSVLHFAARGGSKDIVRYLLDLGVDVNDVNCYGWTALMQAARACDLSLTKFLVERGADLDQQEEFGRTALFFAVESGKIRVVRYLLERGAKVNVRDEYTEETALTIAKKSGREDIVKLLRKYGATE